MKEAALLYSGGTDSTCAAALIEKEFDRIHLLTFSRFGLFCIKNTAANVRALKEKFGRDKFIHRIINVDRLFKEASYAGYFQSLKKYGFFLLTTCGLCKLAMHIRTLIYCLENRIGYVYDGANKKAAYFPGQMEEVIDRLKRLYARYGIIYSNPVFDFDEPKGLGWVDKLGLERLVGFSPRTAQDKDARTSGRILYRMGLLPAENVKGTEIDRRMQARCMQLILFNIFLYWYYLPRNGFERYKQTAVNFYAERIDYFKPLVKEYLEKKKESRLYKLL